VVDGDTETVTTETETETLGPELVVLVVLVLLVLVLLIEPRSDGTTMVGSATGVVEDLDAERDDDAGNGACEDDTLFGR
jgi:hypothetical protein